MSPRKPRAKPYTSSTLDVSRRMIAPGPHHEATAVIYDLMHRAVTLESSLPYYDRTTGKPIAEQAREFRAEARRRIERLPRGELRTNLERENYGRR